MNSYTSEKDRKEKLILVDLKDLAYHGEKYQKALQKYR